MSNAYNKITQIKLKLKKAVYYISVTKLKCEIK